MGRPGHFLPGGGPARPANGLIVGAKRTISILGVLGVLAAAVAPASGSPAYEPERVELGAVNVVSGDSIAGMEVRIPRPTSIQANPFENRDISYEGRGRVIGIALVEEGAPLSRAFQLVGVEWDFCGKPGCASRDRTVLTHASDWGSRRWKIPAGDYRLYLIADGAPVEVELRLEGLEGRRTLRPSGRVAGRIAIPTGAAHPSDNLFLGRARTMGMPTAGLLIDGNSAGFDRTPHGSARGACFWRRGDDGDVVRSTPGPHCYEFAERGGMGAGFGLAGGNSAWGIGNVPAGRWRSSYWAVNVSAFPRTDFLTLWLSYEDPVR